MHRELYSSISASKLRGCHTRYESAASYWNELGEIIFDSTELYRIRLKNGSEEIVIFRLSLSVRWEDGA